MNQSILFTACVKTLISLGDEKCKVASLQASSTCMLDCQTVLVIYLVSLFEQITELESYWIKLDS